MPCSSITTMRSFIALLVCGWIVGTVSVPSASAAEATDAQSSAPSRVRKGLLSYYDFQSLDGAVVRDLAGYDPPLDLRISDLSAVRQSDRGLEVLSKTLIRTDGPATRLNDALRKSNALSVEVWIHPASIKQTGPARLVTLSRNSNERNFTLGQDGDKVEARLRTTGTTTNGMPAVASKGKAVGNNRLHVVYTRDRSGRARIYLDGRLNVEQSVGGATSNWDRNFQLALANELSQDRPWLGTYRLVAIYGRELTSDEVTQNFRAGPLAQHDTEAALSQSHPNIKLFETRIAPLLSKHCLECHDSATKKGRLDLSRKTAALAGGEGGPALVAGQADQSPLWQRVASDEMPSDRDPLSPEEKDLLRKWLDAGADWSLEMIDPAIYAHGGAARNVFVQRLTVPEYIASVRVTLGVDIAKEAREILPRDLRADGFSNTAYNLNVDLAHVEAYSRLAEMIVDRVDIKQLATRYTKSRELSDENLTKIITPLGLLLLRGPLSNEEVQVYCGISTSVAGTGGGFDEALRFILEAMLQAPRFIYRIEGQRGDGTPRPLDPYELASRMSFILWGGPPDAELLKAAEQGKLDRAGVAAQVQRMLADQRAVERSRQFISEWLDLDRMDSLRPSSERFPQWDARLATDMRDETVAFFEEIIWKQQRPLAELLNAQVTFATPRLAKHYGLPIQGNATDDTVVRYDLKAVPSRGGLLTHGSVLTVGGDDASMVTRGLFVMHELLRGVVRDPPPCVDTTPIPTQPGRTQRAIAELRLANSSCTGCHAKFEPLAFALEKLDGVGAHHDLDEHGNKLREDGNILFPGQERPVAFQTAAELMDLLAGSDRVSESLTWKVVQFALGRPLDAEDAPLMAEIHRETQQQGGTYSALMTNLVMSDLVQWTRTEAE